MYVFVTNHLDVHRWYHRPANDVVGNMYSMTTELLDDDIQPWIEALEPTVKYVQYVIRGLVLQHERTFSSYLVAIGVLEP